MVIYLKSGKKLNISNDSYNFKLVQNGSVFEIDFETFEHDADISYTSIHYTIKFSSILSIEVNENENNA